MNAPVEPHAVLQQLTQRCTRNTRATRITITALVGGLTFLPYAVGAQVVEYYHLDAIGSIRAVSNSTGQVIERHDYLPYGEEWCPEPSPGGLCGVPPPGQPRRFTGKERDTETGLDYFGARYYGSRIARFTAVDPVMSIQRALAEPQQWNRYSYVQNRPLAMVDPDGRESMAYTYGNVQISAVTGERIIVAPVSAGQAMAEGAAIGLLSAGLVLGPAVAPTVIATLANPQTQNLVHDALESLSDGPSSRVVVQRAMSRAEAEATRATGLIRGGREGTHFVSDAVNSSAQRARQRLALPQTPEVRATMEVPAGSFSPSSKVAPKHGMPGGGTERTATGAVPAKVVKVDELKK